MTNNVRPDDTSEPRVFNPSRINIIAISQRYHPIYPVGAKGIVPVSTREGCFSVGISTKLRGIAHGDLTGLGGQEPFGCDGYAQRRWCILNKTSNYKGARDAVEGEDE